MAETSLIAYLGGDLAVFSRLRSLLKGPGQDLKMIGPQTPPSELFKGLIIDLSQPIPSIAECVQAWRATLTKNAAIVAFGPHVLTDRLDTARQAGCDVVLTRGQCLERPDTWLHFFLE